MKVPEVSGTAVIIEDNHTAQREITAVLSEFKISVVAYFSSYTEALAAVTRVIAAQGVNYVFLDGSLTRPEYLEKDGRRLAAEIRTKAPNATIFGISNNSDQQGLDLWVSKTPNRIRQTLIEYFAGKS